MRAFWGFFVFSYLQISLAQAAVRSADHSTFNTFFEGIYRVRFTCQSGDRSPRCHQFAPAYHLVVVNSFDEIRFNFFRLPVSEPAPASINMDYSFSVTSFEQRGAKSFLSASPEVNHRAAELAVALGWDENSSKMRFSGWMRDTHFDADVRVSGEMAFQPYTVFDSTYSEIKPLVLSSVIGDFIGSLSGGTEGPKPFVLKIRKSGLSDALLTSIVQSETGMSTDNYDSRVFPNSGGIAIVGYRDGARRSKFKYFLRVSEDAGGIIRLNGASLYTDVAGYRLLNFRQ